jgi:pilus assembly protein CpaB
MKPKTLILMVVAVVCGLGASYMTSRLLAERDDKPAVVERPVEKVTLLVAKKQLDMSTFIKTPQELFIEKQFVKEDAPKEALTPNDLKALVGKSLKRGLRRGDHVLPEDLGDGAPTLEVPPGYRALGLRVTVEGIAGGWASLPGSRVDIIWARRGNNDDTSFAKTLLQNVLVLAADGAKTATDDKAAMPANVVTLALTPEEVRRVALADASGVMKLVLRLPGDTKVDKEDTTTLTQVVTGGGKNEKPKVDEEPEAVPALPTPEPKPEVKPRKTHVVWFRQGDRQWKEVFFLDENGRIITDDAAREDTPEVSAEPPAAPQQPAVAAPKKTP